MEKNLIIIACIDQANGLGNKGQLLYNIKNDKINFRSQTIGNVIIMGRKTYESIGKPLDGRINIVITRNEDYSLPEADNLFIVHSLNDAIELSEAYFSDKEWFVIGGASIYEYAINSGLCHEMRLTIVNDTTDADTYFPVFDRGEWRTYYRSMAQTSSFENVDRSFYFEVLKR